MGLMKQIDLHIETDDEHEMDMINQIVGGYLSKKKIRFWYYIYHKANSDNQMCIIGGKDNR